MSAAHRLPEIVKAVAHQLVADRVLLSPTLEQPLPADELETLEIGQKEVVMLRCAERVANAAVALDIVVADLLHMGDPPASGDPFVDDAVILEPDVERELQSLEQRPVEKFGAGRSADAFEQQVAQYLVGRADGHRPRGFGRLRRPLLLVDQVAVGDLRPAFDRSVVEPPEHVGFDVIVAVDESHVGSRRNGQPRIAGTRQPRFGEVQHTDARIRSRIGVAQLGGGVGRTVLDQNDLDVAERLRPDRFDAAIEPLRRIVHRHDHADFRGCGRAHRSSSSIARSVAARYSPPHFISGSRWLPSAHSFHALMKTKFSSAE